MHEHPAGWLPVIGVAATTRPPADRVPAHLHVRRTRTLLKRSERFPKQRLRFPKHVCTLFTRAAVGEYGRQRIQHACGHWMLPALQPGLTRGEIAIILFGGGQITLGAFERGQIAECNHGALMIGPDGRLQ